jgi:hypothetical protein
MPLQSVSTNEVFTVRVYKLYNQYRWANTYEIVAVSDQQNTGETFWRQLADRFASLESSILFQPIQVDRIVISSYVPDGTPYNPTSFISLPYSIFGTRPADVEILPAEICMVVRKNVVYGRDGRNFYRGTINESNMVSGFPSATLNTQHLNAMQNIFSNWYTSFVNNTIFRVCLASGVPQPTDVRIVTNFVVEPRVTSKKSNNRYFKRNPGVPGPGGS